MGSSTGQWGARNAYCFPLNSISFRQFALFYVTLRDFPTFCANTKIRRKCRNLKESKGTSQLVPDIVK